MTQPQRHPNPKEIKFLAQFYAKGQYHQFNEELGEINGKYRVELINYRMPIINSELEDFQSELTYAAGSINKKYNALALAAISEVKPAPADCRIATPTLREEFARAAENFIALRALAKQYAQGARCYIWFNSPDPEAPGKLISSFHKTEAAAAHALVRKLRLPEHELFGAVNAVGE